MALRIDSSRSVDARLLDCAFRRWLSRRRDGDVSTRRVEAAINVSYLAAQTDDHIGNEVLAPIRHSSSARASSLVDGSVLDEMRSGLGEASCVKEKYVKCRRLPRRLPMIG